MRSMLEVVNRSGTIPARCFVLWVIAVLMVCVSSQLADGATIYVSTNGYDVRGTATNSIQAAVNMASGGDTIIVCDGEYRERIVIDQTYSAALPLTIEADAGASPVVKGSVDFSGDWQTNENDNMVLYEKTVPSSLLTGMVTCRIQQVFCDGVPLRRIGSVNSTISAAGTNINCYWYRDFGEGTNDMVADYYYPSDSTRGSFFHDTATDQLYVRLPEEANPNDHLMEISVKEDVLNMVSAEHVTVRGLTFMHSCGQSYYPSHYGTVVHLGKNALFEDCTVKMGDCHGILVSAGDYTTISNCDVSENGRLGISIAGERTKTREGFVTVQGCLVQSNNNATFCRKASAGGIKLITNARALILDNLITRNHGPGLWIDKCRLLQDAADFNVLAERNRITSNHYYEPHYDYTGYSGVIVEESRHAIVRNNVLRNNGIELDVGVSEHVDVCNNTVINGVGTLALYLWGGARIFNTNSVNLAWEGTNLYARNQYISYQNNLIYSSNPSTRFTWIIVSNEVLQVESNQCVTLDVSCDYNLYYMAAGYATESANFAIGRHSSYSYFSDESPGNPTNFTAWQTNSGWDMHSIVKQDPGSGFALGDYHVLSSNAPCVDAGVTLDYGFDIDDIPRPRDGDNDGVALFDIGASEYACLTRPLNVEASDGAHTGFVRIAWLDGYPATNYTVFRNTVDDSGSAADMSGIIDTNVFDDTAVTTGQVYYYWVKSWSTNQWTDFSDGDSGYVDLVPAVPTNIAPINSVTGQSVQVCLYSSPFIDPDSGDTHGASRWQVDTSDLFTSPVWDSGEVSNGLTEMEIPFGYLSGDTRYYWRVQHRDCHDGWSDWSEPTWFETESLSLYYVSLSGSHVAPYTNWVTAATNIQSAIDAAVAGGVVLVTNGTYLSAAQVFVTNDVVLRSMHGADMTVINGGGSHRCLNIAAGNTVEGFTITNGFEAVESGGGVLMSCGGVLSRSFITGNQAPSAGGVQLHEGGMVQYCEVIGNMATNNAGGGAFIRQTGTVVNCLFLDNYAEVQGGGIHIYHDGIVRNCTVVSNEAPLGAGLYLELNGTVENSILWHNHGASFESTYPGVVGVNENNCIENGGGGVSNLFVDPQFVSMASRDYRLTAASPCINAGRNDFTDTEEDLDGNPRILNGTVDIGVFEYTGTTPPTAVTATDGEYIDSVLVSWAESLRADGYTVYRNTLNETNSATDISGVLSSNSFIDATAVNGVKYFYWAKARVGGQWTAFSHCDTGFANSPPSVPVNVSPIDEAQDQRFRLSLSASAFSDPDSWDTHQASRWQVAETDTFNSVIWDSAETTSALTSVVVPFGPLASLSRYYWRVQYQDSHSGWSDWSTPTWFVTRETHTHYVAPVGGNIAPYTNWATAATNIQAAVDASLQGDDVLVSNGTYLLTAQIQVTNCLMIHSANGAEFTVVDGDGSNRCFYIMAGTVVSGFTVTNGNAGAAEHGGGVFCDQAGKVRDCIITGNRAKYGGGISISCEYGNNVSGTVENCVLVGNEATSSGGGINIWHAGAVRNCHIEQNSANAGGGVYLLGGGVCENSLLVGNYAEMGAGGCAASMGFFNSCLIVGNTSANIGGGLYAAGPACSCTIVSNTAGTGGGVWMYGAVPIRNCIICSNSASTGPTVYSYRSEYDVSFCCLSDPVPTGMGNMTNAPQFVGMEDGDYHLFSTSPCVDAGTNQAWMSGALDLDGNPRIVNSNVDMGAYEFLSMDLDSDSDVMPDWWEWQYGGSLTDMEASGDLDGDGFDNLGEWISGLDPSDSESYFAVNDYEANTNGYILSWPSSSNCIYAVRCSTNLLLEGFADLATNIPATPPQNVYTDATHSADETVYYKIRVQRSE